MEGIMGVEAGKSLGVGVSWDRIDAKRKGQKCREGRVVWQRYQTGFV